MKQDHRQIADETDTSWMEIHSMLQKVTESMNADAAEGQAADRDILRRRAKEYAQRNGNGHDRERNLKDVLLFSLGERKYALPCSHIEEVIPMQSLVALPNSSHAVLGISNNRGVLFAVIDLKRLLSIPASELTTMHRVVMLRHDHYRIGILVDAVHGMDTIDAAELKELPHEIGERTRRFLQGLSPDGILLVSADDVISEMAATAEQ
mgnify:CR=1 FL=1